MIGICFEIQNLLNSHPFRQHDNLEIHYVSLNGFADLCGNT